MRGARLFESSLACRLIFSKFFFRALSAIRRWAPRLPPHRPFPAFHRDLVSRFPSYRTATEPLAYDLFYDIDVCTVQHWSDQAHIGGAGIIVLEEFWEEVSESKAHFTHKTEGPWPLQCKSSHCSWKGGDRPRSLHTCRWRSKGPKKTSWMKSFMES